MQITKPFDKGLNGEMGAVEVADFVELKQPSGKSKGWRKGSTEYETLMNKGS
jgi:hypothetical protein